MYNMVATISKTVMYMSKLLREKTLKVVIIRKEAVIMCGDRC